jgi:hypothetical protein
MNPRSDRSPEATSRLDGFGRTEIDSGFSMVVTLISLVLSALLVALLLSATLRSSGTSKKGISNAPGVGQADNLLAQQSLASSLTTATSQAAGLGGFGSLSAAALSAAEPSTTFTSGASTNSSTVSVASSLGTAGGSGGSITLAALSSAGICWYLWQTTGGVAWYGAQTGQTSCTAPAIDTAPSEGPASSAAVGWLQGHFPPA